jgi:DNA-binding SARP family transcriptional activator
VAHQAYRGQLLDRAFLRLSPDVFFHPVWTYFVETGPPFSSEQIQSLLDARDELLSAGSLVEACQILFICAFQQLRAGDYAAVLANLQHALVLAEAHELPQAAWWAAWGAAAVCVQQGGFQQAAEHLEHLQSMLGQQHEWVLANVIDVLRQTLLSQTQAGITAGQPLSSDAVLSSTFEQLQHWGTPCAVSRIDYDDLVGGGHPGRPATASSGPTGFTWHSLWQKIKRIANGELRLKWVETNDSARLPLSAESNALLPISPVVVVTPVPAPLSPSDDQPPAQDQQPEIEHHLPAAHDYEPAAIQPSVPDKPEPAAKSPAPPSITAHLLGTFSFSVNDATVQSWPTGKGRTVFKYLLAHHNEPIPRDVLMDVFWPQAGPEAARNSLNVTLHGLRQALKTVTDMPVILFEEGAYCFNPEFHIWTDVDEFDRHVQAGRRFEAKEQLVRAITEYEAAMELYQGDFLSGDLYEEWPLLPRERLRVAFQDTLDRLSRIFFSRQQYVACEAICQQILARDNCREDAHCLLMRCYSRQEQQHLALRQYQACADALRSELDVAPAPATAQLFERIRRREAV